MDALGAVRGTDAAAAVASTIAALSEAEHLPGLLDTPGVMPPTSQAWVRRVSGRNLWLWYRFTESELVCVTLTNSPPIPV